MYLYYARSFLLLQIVSRRRMLRKLFQVFPSVLAGAKALTFMLYSFDRFPEGPERSSFSLATASDAMEGPADFRVLADMSSGCERETLAVEGLPSLCEHPFKELFTAPAAAVPAGLWYSEGILHDKAAHSQAWLSVCDL